MSVYRSKRIGRRLLALFLVLCSWGLFTQGWSQFGPIHTFDAERLREHQWVESRLDDRYDRDVYQISLSSPAVLKVETRGHDIDPLCILYDRSKRELAQDDDGGMMRNCQVVLQLPRGEYYLEVRPAFGSSEGAYEVRYTVSRSSSARSYGERRTSAPTIRDRDRVEATMTARGEHWYELRSDGNSTSTIEVKGFSGLSCAITDRNGRDLVQSRSSGRTCEVSHPGSNDRMYARVWSTSSSSVGDYELSYRQSRIRDDHSNSRSGATRIRSRQSVSGYLTPGDSDYFELSPREGRRVRFYTRSDEQTDTYCVLYDERGRRLATDDNRGGSRQCQLDFEADESRYYVEVRGANGRVSGSYDVRYDD